MKVHRDELMESVRTLALVVRLLSLKARQRRACVTACYQFERYKAKQSSSVLYLIMPCFAVTPRTNCPGNVPAKTLEHNSTENIKDVIVG